MTAVSIRVSVDVATVECEACGHFAAVGTSDTGLLVTAVRGFLSDHGSCGVASVDDLESWLD